MKKKLLLHFGIHRTGTTHLQKVLKHNREDLRKKGILYPRLEGSDESHSAIAWGLVRSKISAEDLIKTLHSSAEPDTHTIVLSHEDFSRITDHQWLARLNEDFDARVFVYLRRQDLWLESWYNQNIKWPWDKKFSHCRPAYFLKHYKDFYWLDYFKLLQGITDVLGREKLYVNVVDQLGVKNTTQDFLDQAGIECVIPSNLENTNSSISTAKLDILRRIDLLTLGNANKAKVKILNALRNLEVANDDGTTIIFSDEQIEFVLDTFSDSNQKVANVFFGRDVLFGDEVKTGRNPCFVSDHDAYRIYLPKLLKEIAKK